MTISEVITRVNDIEPNQYDNADKMEWLNRLEGQIFDELILTHEHEPDITFKKHTSESEELFVPFPYGGEVYEYYLKAMIAEANHETVKYNIAMALFNAAYGRYSSWYNRKHKPLPHFPRNRLHF